MPLEKTKPSFETLLTDLILALHHVAVDEPLGIRDQGTLDFIVKSACETEGSNLDLAANLLFNIATRHPFFDGNKRTATLSALTILLSGNLSEPTQDALAEFLKLKAENEYEKFILDVAKYSKTESQVRDYLKRRFNKE